MGCCQLSPVKSLTERSSLDVSRARPAFPQPECPSVILRQMTVIFPSSSFLQTFGATGLSPFMGLKSSDSYAPSPLIGVHETLYPLEKLPQMAGQNDTSWEQLPGHPVARRPQLGPGGLTVRVTAARGQKISVHLHSVASSPGLTHVAER